MKVRLWLIEHSLSPAEEQRVRENRKARDINRGPDKITYRKKRVVKEVDGYQAIGDAISYALTSREMVEDLPDVYSRFTTVFAAAPAEDGEKCSQIENAWTAEEVELPLE